MFRPRWRNRKHTTDWMATLENHAFPSLWWNPRERRGPHRENWAAWVSPPAARAACTIEVLRFMASFPFRHDPVVLAAAGATTATAAGPRGSTNQDDDAEGRLQATDQHRMSTSSWRANPRHVSPNHPLNNRQITRWTIAKYPWRRPLGSLRGQARRPLGGRWSGESSPPPGPAARKSGRLQRTLGAVCDCSGWRRIPNGERSQRCPGGRARAVVRSPGTARETAGRLLPANQLPW